MAPSRPLIHHIFALDQSVIFAKESDLRGEGDDVDATTSLGRLLSLLGAKAAGLGLSWPAPTAVKGFSVSYMMHQITIQHAIRNDPQLVQAFEAFQIGRLSTPVELSYVPYWLIELHADAADIAASSSHPTPGRAPHGQVPVGSLSGARGLVAVSNPPTSSHHPRPMDAARQGSPSPSSRDIGSLDGEDTVDDSTSSSAPLQALSDPTSHGSRIPASPTPVAACHTDPCIPSRLTAETGEPLVARVWNEVKHGRPPPRSASLPLADIALHQVPSSRALPVGGATDIPDSSSHEKPSVLKRPADNAALGSTLALHYPPNKRPRSSPAPNIHQPQPARRIVVALSDTTGSESGGEGGSESDDESSDEYENVVIQDVQLQGGNDGQAIEIELNQYVERQCGNRFDAALWNWSEEFATKIPSCKADAPAKYQTRFLNASCSLYGYQKHAVAELHANRFEKRQGMLLADEMGLGKTITVIGALCLKSFVLRLQVVHRSCTARSCTSINGSKPCIKAASTSRAWKWPVDDLPALILAPVHAVHIWHAELLRWRNRNLDVRVLHGKSCDPLDGLSGRTVILTTYHSMRTRLPVELDVSFSVIVCDEVHDWRRTQTTTAKQILGMRAEPTVLWLLTGTPMPKGPPSLDLIARGLFDDEGGARYRAMLDVYRSVHALLNRAARSTGLDPQRRARLQGDSFAGLKQVKDDLVALLRPCLIRRSAESLFRGEPILQLPKQTSSTYTLGFANADARASYQDVVARVGRDLIRRPAKYAVIRKMDISRMCASFPALGRPEHHDWLAQGSHTYGELADHYRPHAQHLYESSSKAQYLVRRCHQMRRSSPTATCPYPPLRDRMVIFFNFPIEVVVMTEILSFCKIRAAPFHSRLGCHERHALIQSRLQGLEGTAASVDVVVGTLTLMGQAHTMNRVRHIVLPAPAWLRCEEDQAAARNRRVGQTKETTVTRLIADHTIDITIRRRQEQRGLFNDSVFGYDMQDDDASRRAVAEAYGIELVDDSV